MKPGALQYDRTVYLIVRADGTIISNGNTFVYKCEGDSGNILKI